MLWRNFRNLKADIGFNSWKIIVIKHADQIIPVTPRNNQKVVVFWEAGNWNNCAIEWLEGLSG